MATRTIKGYSKNIIALVKALTTSRLTIREISKQFGVTERTVYRMLVMIEEMDFPVEEDFDRRHFIPADFCPFCERKIETTTNGVNQL